MAADLEKYIQEKEHIDTLIIPLLPISFSSDQELSKLSFNGSVLSILMSELERELHGRILLSPAYHYIRTKDLGSEMKRLNQWIEDAVQQPFKHIFLISHDVTWKKNEEHLKGTYVWISSIPSVQIDSKEMQQFVRNQIEQLNVLLQTYW